MQTELSYLLENYKQPLHNVTMEMLIGFIKESYKLQEKEETINLKNFEL